MSMLHRPHGCSAIEKELPTIITLEAEFQTRFQLLPCNSSAFVALTLVLMLVYSEVVEELVLLSNTVFIVLYIIGSLAGLALLDKKTCPAICL